MVKRVSSEFMSKPTKNTAMIRLAITNLIRILKANNQVDTELELLMHKYESYLNDV